MLSPMLARSLAALLALSVIGCGSSVQQASVGASVPSPPRSVAAGDDSELELDRAHSRVEVAGSDRVTGEHVAVIRSLSVHLSGVHDDKVREVLIIADLRTLSMKSRMVENFVKSEDFLDVAHYPEAVFRSHDVEHKDGQNYDVRGVLDLHGVAREIRFVAHVARTRGGATLSADFLLPRQAFEIRRRDGWDFLISDDFRVKVEIAARPAQKRSDKRLAKTGPP